MIVSAYLTRWPAFFNPQTGACPRSPYVRLRSLPNMRSCRIGRAFRLTAAAPHSCFRRFVVGGAATLMALVLAACGEPVWLSTRGERVHIVSDSPSAQMLIGTERALQQTDPKPASSVEIRQLMIDEVHGHTPPRRREFLNVFAATPGFDISEQTDADILEDSDCRCTLHAIFTTSLVKLRITSGPFQGRVGWVCEDQVVRVGTWQP